MIANAGPSHNLKIKTLVRKWFQIQRKKILQYFRGICEELKEYILFQKF
jgi:hypothetical protein